MKISKNSWHYKLGNSNGSYAFQERCHDNAHTTCTYIRGVANAMFRVTASVVFLLAAFIFAVIVLASMLTVPTAIALGIPILNNSLLGAMVAPCLVGWMAVVIGLLGYLLMWITDKMEARHKAKVSLLKQAALDKKEGICTLVRFE